MGSLAASDNSQSLVVAEVRALAGPAAALDPRLIDAAVRAWSDNTKRAFVSDLTPGQNGAASDTLHRTTQLQNLLLRGFAFSVEPQTVMRSNCNANGNSGARQRLPAISFISAWHTVWAA